jgi:hypothetical protein
MKGDLNCMHEPRGDEKWLGLRGLTPADAKAIARKRGPTDGSVNAFVQWLQKIGETGEFDRDALFDLYEWSCELAGERPKTCDKWFKQEMRGCGCTTGKTDKRVKGKGSRKVTIIVPHVPTKVTSATGATGAKTSATSLPTRANAHSKPISKHLAYLAKAA